VQSGLVLVICDTSGVTAEPERMQPDLIYDIGLHRGEDTAYYLAKGFRVVAFEADPGLVQHCTERFAAEIATGRLRIVSGAISESAERTVPLYRSDVSVWSSVEPMWVSRKNVQGIESSVIDVPMVDLVRELRLTGIPFYAKVDIEGSDLVCLRAFRSLNVRPTCLSIEAEQYSFRSLVAEIRLLQELGYTEFCAVQQEGVEGREFATRDLAGRVVRHRFDVGASGPFGDDLDGWCNVDEVIEIYRRIFRLHRLSRALGQTGFGRRVRWHLFRRVGHLAPGWYDTHARQARVEGV
jgi:FkbM family methyltransferase